MEPNPPVLAKKVWSLMRLMFFMLKKGITKTRLFSDLNIMIKRGKLAGKSLHKILFHHHHNWAATTFHPHPHHLRFPTPPPTDDDDEFSCTTSPLSLSPINKKHHINDHEIIVDPDMIKAVEMLKTVAGSPGFWKTPVRQLRVTDSPFPLSNGDEGGQVDEAAEKFIMRFYNGLKRED